jgi:hypothetical protein
VAYNHHGDLCLGFWADAWHAGVITFPAQARVLEIGCAEANWITPMIAERPDLLIDGVDWRACTREGAQRVIRGDVREVELPGDYDAIVSVSAIEHIGLGSYDQDPKDPDGDTIAMRRSYGWLKPGGWMYLDVPYREPGKYHVTGNYRGYDEDAIQSRLLTPGWTEVWRKVVGEKRGDGPYLSLVLQK